jgi:hypothetical protein
MTTLAAPAAPAPETPSVEISPAPAAWLGWGIAAMGFAALALSLVVSLGQASAETAQAERSVAMDAAEL